MKFLLFFIFLLINCHEGLTQTKSVLDSIHAQLQQYADLKLYSFDEERPHQPRIKVKSYKDTVRLTYTNRFFIGTPGLSHPEKRMKHPHKNTVEFYFTIAPNWNQERLEQQRRINQNVYTIESKRFIAYNDSIGWIGHRGRLISGFNANWFSILTKWDQSNKTLLSEVQRLPDFMINGTGVFIDNNFEGDFYFIAHHLVRREIEEIIRYVMQLDQRFKVPFDDKANY